MVCINFSAQLRFHNMQTVIVELKKITLESVKHYICTLRFMKAKTWRKLLDPSAPPLLVLPTLSEVNRTVCNQMSTL